MGQRILHVTLTIFMSISAYPQSDKLYTERLDSIITSVNLAGEVKSVFHYNGKGLLVEKIEYREKKEGIWINPERTLYTYDCNDRIASLVSNIVDSCEQGGAFRERREYDSMGNLISQTYDRFLERDGMWQMKGLVEHVYDDKGHQVERMDYYYKDGERKNKLKSENNYDRRGRLITKREYEFIKEEMQLWRIYQYSYDRRGNLCTAKKFFSEHYDTLDNSIITTQRTYNRHDGKVSVLTRAERGADIKKEEYSYDHHGNLIQIATFRLSDGAWEHWQNMTFTYDMTTPVSSVMGLSCPEVLCNDYALKNGLNMTCKPFSVNVNEVDNSRFHEEAFYYYSSINENPKNE